MSSNEDRVTGWWVFAGILLAIAGTLNMIWGIAAIGNAHFFTENAHYIVSSLNTWGWVTVFIAAIQFFAAASLFTGGGFGRWVGILAASLSAIGSLMSIPAYPLWSLCVFALAVIIIYELAKAPVRNVAG